MRTSIVDVYAVDHEAVVRAIDRAIEQGQQPQQYLAWLRDECGVQESFEIGKGLKIIDEQKYMMFLLKWAQ
jgi:hypothetical protein